MPSAGFVGVGAAGASATAGAGAAFAGAGLASPTGAVSPLRSQPPPSWLSATPAASANPAPIRTTRELKVLGPAMSALLFLLRSPERRPGKARPGGLGGS